MAQGIVDGPKIFVGNKEVTNPLILRRFQESSGRLEATINSLNLNNLVNITKDTLVPLGKFKAVQRMLLHKEFFLHNDNFIEWYNTHNLK